MPDEAKAVCCGRRRCKWRRRCGSVGDVARSEAEQAQTAQPWPKSPSAPRSPALPAGAEAAAATRRLRQVPPRPPERWAHEGHVPVASPALRESLRAHRGGIAVTRAADLSGLVALTTIGAGMFRNATSAPDLSGLTGLTTIGAGAFPSFFSVRSARARLSGCRLASRLGHHG